VPEWVLQYLDECADSVWKLARWHADVPDPESLLTSFGFRRGKGKPHVFSSGSRRTDEALFISAMTQVKRDGHQRSHAPKVLADRLGMSEGKAKQLLDRFWDHFEPK
jgi:hypothetical protein